LAARLTDNQQQYTASAKDHLDYLVGRNALSQSYITGYGDNAAEHPHHRLSVAAGETVPGMVVGGPNAGLQDPLAKSRLEGAPPAKCYIDEEPSYSTNEITIYWNSPALFLVTQFVE
jgi:endoglucanase